MSVVQPNAPVHHSPAAFGNTIKTFYQLSYN